MHVNNPTFVDLNILPSKYTDVTTSKINYTCSQMNTSLCLKKKKFKWLNRQNNCNYVFLHFCQTSLLLRIFSKHCHFVSNKWLYFVFCVFRSSRPRTRTWTRGVTRCGTVTAAAATPAWPSTPSTRQRPSRSLCGSVAVQPTLHIYWA